MALDEEGRSAKGVEGALSIELNADVELVIANCHQGVLKLVHTVTHSGKYNILESTSSNLNDIDFEEIVHVILEVSKLITDMNYVTLLDAHNSILVVNRVS